MIPILRQLPKCFLGIPVREFCCVSKQPHMYTHIPRRDPNLPTVDFFRLSKQPHNRAHIPRRVPNLLKSVKFMFCTQHQKARPFSVPYRAVSFEELIKSKIFVDKTNFIYDMLRDSRYKLAILILRPKRWGKSLQLDMTRAYLKIEVTQQGKRKYKSAYLLKRSSMWMRPMSSKERNKCCQMLKEYLREQNGDKLKDEIEEDLQRQNSQDLSQGVQAAWNKIAETKVESREMVKLISGKMQGLNEEQLRKFIQSFIDWDKISYSQTILLHQKIVLAKETNPKTSEDEKKRVKTLITNKQNQNIQNKQQAWVKLIETELKEIQSNQMLAKVGLVVLGSLRKKDLIVLLQRQLTEEDCLASIGEIKQKLGKLAECQSKSMSSIQELIRLIKVQVKQTIKQIKWSQQYLDLKEKILTEVRQDEAHKALTEKKRLKNLFYGENSLNITKEDKVKRNRKKSAVDVQDELQINKQNMEQYYMGEYPIIFFTLPDLERASTLQDMKKELSIEISKTYREHSYLIKVFEQLIANEKSQIMKDCIRTQLKRFMSMLDNNSVNQTFQYFQRSLTFLSDLLYRHFGKKVIYLIDEFDRPCYSSIGKQQSYLIQIQLINMLSKVLKQDQKAEKIILTGVTSAYGPDLSDGINNIVYYNIDTQSVLNQHLGFTQGDVDNLVMKVVKERSQFVNAKQLDSQELKKAVKKWCHGYYINQKYIYNPWSVCLLLSFLDQDYKKLLRRDWAQPGYERLIKKFILENPFSTNVIKLIMNDKVDIDIPGIIDVNDLKNQTRESDYFYLLFRCGLLTRVEGKKSCFKIPNQQIKLYLYNIVVKDWIEKVFGINVLALQSLAERLIENVTNSLTVQKTLQKIFTPIIKDNTNIQESLKNSSAYNYVEIFNFNIVALSIIVAFRFCQSSSNQQILTLARPESVREAQKKIDLLIIPSETELNTVIVFELNLVQPNSSDQEKKATKQLQNSLWRILASDYFSQGIKACEQNDKANIKIVSTVVHSQSRVWISSHTFTKEKGRQLSNIFEQFVRKQSGQTNKAEQTVKTELISGFLKKERNLSQATQQQQVKRKKLLSMVNESTLQQLLAKFQFEAETLKQKQQPQERQQNNQDNSISKESSKEEIRKRSKRRIKRTMSPQNEK